MPATKASASADDSRAGSSAKSEKLVPAAPEPLRGASKKRKRLAKAFKRPLDKKLKNGGTVRETFTLAPADLVQLAELKQRLMIQGLNVKKSELARAGLLLLATLDDADLTVVLDNIRSSGI
ncbi:MAG: hypothetical protein ABI478_04785 [Propionivibrio sp.]